MNRQTIAVLAAVTLSVPLFAATHPPKGTIGLGVGARSASEIVVKIDGKNTPVKLAGLPPNGTYAGQAFLDCLVSKRVLHVDRVAGRATMLDGTSVADHVAEFLQTSTQTDPCTLGKAAYVPEMPALAGTPAATPANATAVAPAPARGRGHVSFGSGPAAKSSFQSYGPTGQGEGPRRAPAATPTAPKYSDTPTIYQPPVIGGSAPVTGTVGTLPQGNTTTIGSAGTYQPGQAQPYTPPTVGTTTIPTTSTNPP